MPNHLGLAAVMRRALAGEDLVPLCQSLLQRAAEDASETCALLDASLVMQCLGHPDIGLQLQREALVTRRHYCLPTRRPTRLRLLALMAPGAIMANVPVECLLEDSDVELHLYYAATEAPAAGEIPEHDVLFVAIGESEANRPLLDAWTPRLTTWPRPVLNDPRRIGRTARDLAYQHLHTLPGLVMPPTWRLDRRQLGEMTADQLAESGLRYPLIVRPVGSHAGHDLVRLDHHDVLRSSLETLSGDVFFVSPFIDYRGADGLFRKYRVFLIDGHPFACHMAVSAHWMIHYLNAGMADSPDKRAEEARFMATFEQDFAQRHRQALAGIHAAIGLDYLGIDCAETPDGCLLVFEIDPAMVAHAMDPVDLYPYKPATMAELFAGFRAMLSSSIRMPLARVPELHPTPT